MRIGVLGAGSMAGALGGKWVAAGHEVLVGARVAERAAVCADRIGARAGSLGDALSFGEAVLLAVPAGVAADCLGDAAGKIVVDCTNSVVQGRFVLDEPAQALRLAGTGARVVKAFNLCHVDVWRRPSPVVFGDRPLAVPLCGDDPEAVALVGRLVRDAGGVPVDGGPLERAALLEATAAFAIGMWVKGVDVRAAFTPLEAASG
ncbi:NADPH-dependent F420 reductase [Saccharothrix coeruleofusca]|uniref:NADP oxidoreductase n=1 Tax=Saccharothrix coeruleofusca TaxID=33919 RepID=A0A918ANH5_9PSEU|nr:NAD(P)-binding domain-containing protein [Saccharothrix coeruleofusca]GGP65050.1 NADP oxidoreductase [Saccharothrix coeruleofusca]